MICDSWSSFESHSGAAVVRAQPFWKSIGLQRTLACLGETLKTLMVRIGDLTKVINKPLLKAHASLFVVLATFITLGTVYNVALPLFEAPDEMDHFRYVNWLAIFPCGRHV
jgi:hypothetical protein